MRFALALTVLIASGIGVARADDLCARPHHGSTVDVDFKDADVHSVLRVFADVGHVNLVVNDQVKGKVTIKLKKVAWDAAVCAVADMQHLAIDVSDNILVVTPKSATP